MSPTRRPTKRPSAGPERAAAAAPIRRSVLSPWWRTARTCCSAARWAAYRTGEITLAKAVLPRLKQGMLCLADRNFFGFALVEAGAGNGRGPAVAVKKNMRLACEKRLPDGSYLSRIYPSERDWRHKTNGIVVRVIEYRLDGIADAEPLYRLVTTILDPDKAPADRTGGAVPRALGDRNRVRRTQDPPARRQDRPAQQDARSGPAGVLRAHDGPLRHPRPDARSRAESR